MMEVPGNSSGNSSGNNYSSFKIRIRKRLEECLLYYTRGGVTSRRILRVVMVMPADPFFETTVTFAKYVQYVRCKLTSISQYSFYSTNFYDCGTKHHLTALCIRA